MESTPRCGGRKRFATRGSAGSTRRYAAGALVLTTVLALITTYLLLAGPHNGRPGVTAHPSATPSAPSVSHRPALEPPRTRADALRHQLASNTFVRLELLGIGPGGFAAPAGHVLCSLHVMGSSDRGSTLYIWLGCDDFITAKGGTVAEASGGRSPAVVEVRGRGAATEVESITFPRQAYLDADMKRLFPPSIAAHIYDEANAPTSPSPAELKEEAAALGTTPPRDATTPVMQDVEECSSWLARGSSLLSAITARYGDPHDCLALSGAWVMTTDRATGAGFIGVHVCEASCAADIPMRLADWTFHQPATGPGAYERVAGTNPDGSILFVGSAGEIAFDPSTGAFEPSVIDRATG